MRSSGDSDAAGARVAPGVDGNARRGATRRPDVRYAFGARTRGGPVHLDLVTILVADYDPAIRFFVDTLGFELVSDAAATTSDGGAKRWVVVRPPRAATGLLLARADGERQAASIGDQRAGRVGFFLRVTDFDATYRRMAAAGVTFVGPPRAEPYGPVAVFLDIAGNRWDLLGPPPADA